MIGENNHEYLIRNGSIMAECASVLQYDPLSRTFGRPTYSESWTLTSQRVRGAGFVLQSSVEAGEQIARKFQGINPALSFSSFADGTGKFVLDDQSLPRYTGEQEEQKYLIPIEGAIERTLYRDGLSRPLYGVWEVIST